VRNKEKKNKRKQNKNRSCLTNLISFYDKVMHLVDEGKAVDVVYLDFSKALTPFPTAFSSRNWLLLLWTGVRFVGLETGWKGGPKESW